LRRALEKKHLLFTPVHVLNMEFPGHWDVFPMEEYATAIARSPGKAGMEVMAKARANGRLVDHFKVTVNGSEVLHVDFPISALFTVADLPNWRVQWDTWPRDIPIRRNMSSSGWLDLYTGVLSNEIFIFDEKGPVLKDKIEGFFHQGKGKMTLHAAYRWAVVISEDQRMMLCLYGLPASVTTLEGPHLQRVSGFSVWTLSLRYPFPVAH
jgi:hypothetical protein